MEQPKTIKVKPWGEGQGDFVVINEADLTNDHEAYEEPGGDAGEEAQRRGRPRKVQE